MLKSGDKRPEDYRQLWATITGGREWHGVFLNKRKDGVLFWEAASISPLRDDDGRVTHFVAVKEDITQRKRAEDTLRLHATVFATTTEGIIVTDAQNRIKTVNPAFTHITGYSQEEVVGRDPKLLGSGRNTPDFYRTMWQSLHTTGHWSGEIWNRRKDGTIFPEWLSVVAIRDERGNVQEYIGVFSDITQRKHDEEQILRQANYDALTGLPNRALLFDRLSQAIALAHRDETKVALLFIDLDRFKSINDGLGHAVGDDMLRLVAERLRVCVRQSDTVARFGGDEFVIILENVKDVPAVAALAGKVVRVLSEPFHLAGRELFIGASIGVTLYPEDSTDPNTLLRNADMAMYQAKEGGRSQFQFFTQEMNRRTEARIELERGLHRALEREQFTLQYQPIFSLQTGEMASVEVLLRWNHPELGPVRPDRFIPLAEDSGLIAPIGLWVLRTACAQVSQWRKRPEFAALRLAVNLSSRQWQLGLPVSTIRDILSETGLAPEALVLEITEGMVLEGTEEVIAWLYEIRALGVELAVDDFGTGYSSLSYLKRFPVSELKIDYSFIRDLPDDEGSASLVRAILSMARSLGLAVVAEGVETPAQLAFLEQARCDYVQGYLLSPPIPAEQIPDALHQRAGERLQIVPTARLS